MTHRRVFASGITGVVLDTLAKRSVSRIKRSFEDHRLDFIAAPRTDPALNRVIKKILPSNARLRFCPCHGR
jgi:hypothetical protein